MDYPTEVPCQKCGTLCKFTPRPDTSHWGSIRCPNHGFLWIPKSDDDRKPKRKTNEKLRKMLPEAMQCYCWACLRTELHLRLLRPAVVLQVHHVIEVEKGGTDDPANLQILCSECHGEVHRRREAFNRYQAQR